MYTDEELADSRWRERKLEILKRDGYACVACKSTGELYVHHCYHVLGRMPWQYGELALKTLCRKCYDVVYLPPEEAIQDEETWDRWCDVEEACRAFQLLEDLVVGMYADLMMGKNLITGCNLVVNTAFFLSERTDREEGPPTDPKVKSARLALFYEAGMAGVFTEDFVKDMVAKTAELNAKWKEKRRMNK